MRESEVWIERYAGGWRWVPVITVPNTSLDIARELVHRVRKRGTTMRVLLPVRSTANVHSGCIVCLSPEQAAEHGAIEQTRKRIRGAYG